MTSETELVPQRRQFVDDSLGTGTDRTELPQRIGLPTTEKLPILENCAETQQQKRSMSINNVGVSVESPAIPRRSHSKVKVKIDSVADVSLGPHRRQVQGQRKQQFDKLKVSMSARDLMVYCKTEAASGMLVNNVGNYSILGENVDPPPKPNVCLTADRLSPQTPSVLIENETDALSPHLHELCLSHPIVVIRSITSTLGFDFSRFSTKTFVESHPNHPIEVRTQAKVLLLGHSLDENVDDNGNTAWLFKSDKYRTTIAKYAVYQCNTFENFVKRNASKSLKSRKQSRRGFIKFGTNLDLSDDKRWKAQLTEINKLPHWIRVASPGNLLSYVGHAILGMNTLQAYMKVPGCRTPGHQENNNFCSINISIGPGDCEWFAVPYAYWGCVQRLCERNNINFLHGSWWPNIQDLYDEGIPVYRFIQRPGDLVWVNSGCVHWVQSIGFCNNVAWNVGPLSARQFQLALERYEWNKVEMFKSIVPMIHLSWNVANTLFVADPKLFALIRTVLMKSLVQCMRVLEFVKIQNLQVGLYARAAKEPSHYCDQCEVEVFNILFVQQKELQKRHVVHCFDCALRQSPNLQGFGCLQEFSLEILFGIYDNFKLAL